MGFSTKIIGSKIDLPINHIDKRVREINCGQIEGTTEEERVKQWGSNWSGLELGMEKFEDVSLRGRDFFT
ncbi:histidine phosphatase family protein [Cytobacillus sp. FJAT-54145]|uniref:Histidine phosphatase family protein n=1 Tax=Cytobacillus spartinae TaxID=3299023 RepID=A0ABW6K6E8_9BACI